LVWSTEDPALARAQAEDSAKFVSGPYRFEVIEGVDHWLPEHAAERVTALLLEQFRAYPVG
jgi:pimeloyl-ACP methyl ester carboxylesterase